MDDFIISTESTCDLAKATLLELGVSSINLEYCVGGEQFGVDGAFLENKDFYARMRKGEKTSTSMVNDQRARAYLESLLKSGKDVLHLSFASACSGTCDAFKRASNELNEIYDNKVIVIDSRCESTAQGLLVRLCVEKRQAGASLIEAKAYCEDILRRINSLFTVDNLKYLVAGGRVGKTTAIIGGVLNIKPILFVDDEGKLTPGGKVISRKLSLARLTKMAVEKFSGECPYVYVSHADCYEDALFVVEKLKKELDAQIFIEEIGPVIGSHSGPGTLAVFFVGRDRSF